MIGASSLSGHTLVACHFPGVQLPTWQLPVQALCNSAKRPSRLCSVGLTRAVSLPEQDTLNREHAFTGSQRPFSSSYCSLNEDRAEEEGTSDSSGRYDSTSSPEDTSSLLKKESPEVRGSQRLHNSFRPNTDPDEDEEDEDSDGDNLHRYDEDSSFVLHGNSNWPINDGVVTDAVMLGDLDSEWGNEGTVLGTRSDREWVSSQMDSLQPECQCFHVNRLVSPCLEQGPDRLQDNMSCCIHSQHKCSPELQSNSHTEYISDSSCNSSDGILVNFCTIFNKSNNPATPHDLSSPGFNPCRSTEGSVFLNLQPVPQSQSEHVLHDEKMVYSSPKEEADVGLSGPPCWSPQSLDSNCNLYSLEVLPTGLSSLEVSDLAACLQSQSTLAIGTNQKYYKLVSCDLSSQSPSPAWSSLTSCHEGAGRSSPFLPPACHKSEGQLNEIKKNKEEQHQEKCLTSAPCSSRFDSSHVQTSDYQVATTSTDKALCRKQHTDSIRNISLTPCSSCPGRCSLGSSKCQDARDISKLSSAFQEEELSNSDPSDMGACSLEKEMVHTSKPQRPTSLPIQPFVLLPAGKPKSQAQHLGCLLEQYINHKSHKPGNSQPGLEFKVKRSQCLSNLHSSLMESHCPVFLEAPSTSDSCSTCTPSPDCFSHRRTWNKTFKSERSPSTSKGSLESHHSSVKAEAVQVQRSSSPDCCKTQASSSEITAPNQSNFVKIPTYQDLITLNLEQTPPSPEPRSPSMSLTQASYHLGSSYTPPTLPLTAETHHPNLKVTPSPFTSSQSQQKNPADCSFFHSSFTAALSSVAPLSSLSSLLSLATSGLHPQQTQDSARLISKSSQHSESLILSDRPPTEFFLSPDASYESMSISHLQRRGLLRNVSSAVDLITAHFGSSRDPEEKMRLGNSSYSSTIAGLVLEHLCPAVQKILEDGLRDHKLDYIIGQRRNHSWSVVEISTTVGPSTKVLHSLVSKIRQCPQLTSHCMRLRAFIMGLLNLRALEFWFSHLQSQRDVVATHYHSWSFLFMSLDRCQPLFQELLLLLQPLSVLPIDLNLLLEPRLLRHRVCSEVPVGSPPQPCSALLVTSWPKLQVDRKEENNSNFQKAKIPPHRGQDSLSLQNLGCYKQQLGSVQVGRSPLAPIPEFLPKECDREDGVAEAVDFSQNQTDTWFQISMHSKQEERTTEQDCRTENLSPLVKAESPHLGGLRWAKLFGAADTPKTAENDSQHHSAIPTRRLPSQWLHLDRSQLGILAQSIKSLKPGRAQQRN